MDKEISLGWHELYDFYVKQKNLIPDDKVIAQYDLLKAKVQNDHHRVEEIVLDKDIPKLSVLIESSSEKEELEKELKRLVIKYYWSGFTLGQATTATTTTRK
ncbi:hypothetical protein KGF56_004124 [Candida oxycetoniae]|uniref:Uncharacterized protein n=1 Tax=Candida oxycetoniae TaxID=497107 RepID=A0AAI9SUR3_9ASCO|nr:uncharacterized protein KGF56_004124 [Candida oxycetoniae]KAI3403064.2 hypothetical protein KGF56_004124 [Candida oxycetoniae]